MILCRAIAGATWRPVRRRPASRSSSVPRTCATFPGTSARPTTGSEGYGAYRHRDPRRDQPRPSTLPRRDPRSPGRTFAAEGADVIDLGCDPGEPWAEVGDAVSAPPRSRPSASRSTASTRTRSPAPSRRRRAGPERERDPTAIGPPTGASRSSPSPTGRARSTGWTRRSRRSTRAGRPVPHRPDPGADRLRLRGLAGPLPRGPPALSRGAI